MDPVHNLSGLSPSDYFVILGLFLSTYSVWTIWHIHERRKEDNLFAKAHGCESLPLWVAKWPLGLDLLIGAIQHVKNRTILSYFVEIGEQCPTTHQQNLLFESNIGTADARNVEAILSKQFEDFDLGLRPEQFADIFGSGSIITQDGQAWKRSRDMLRPLFGPNRIQNFEEIQKSVDKFLDALPTNGKVDLQPLFFQLTLETTLFLLFGTLAATVRATGVVDGQANFATAFNDGQEFLTFRVRLGGLYRLYNTRRYRDTCAKVRKFVDDIVKEALEAESKTQKQRNPTRDKSEERFVLLEAMLEHTKDKNVLRDQCLSFLLAGRDSTACALTWTMFLLVRHPHCLVRLQCEIEAAFGMGADARVPTREGIRKMKYLDAVIKEVLRLYPPIPVNVRAASKLTTLPVGGGPDGTAPCLVRKGTAVTWSPYAMHRRKDIFGTDAHAFRPERWEGDVLKDLGYAYIPFNGGKRSCLGQDFAMMEIAYTIVRLLQRVPHITIPDGHITCETGKEKQLMTLVLSSAEGCWVQCGKAEGSQR